MIVVAASSVVVSAMRSQSIASASISELAILVPRVAATVTVSEPPPVVVIPDPAAMVTVSPEVMVWFVPDVPAKVKSVVALVRKLAVPDQFPRKDCHHLCPKKFDLRL